MASQTLNIIGEQSFRASAWGFSSPIPVGKPQAKKFPSNPETAPITKNPVPKQKLPPHRNPWKTNGGSVILPLRVLEARGASPTPTPCFASTLLSTETVSQPGTCHLPSPLLQPLSPARGAGEAMQQVWKVRPGLQSLQGAVCVFSISGREAFPETRLGHLSSSAPKLLVKKSLSPPLSFIRITSDSTHHISDKICTRAMQGQP